MSYERLLKTIEAARYLDVPGKTLKLYVKQGKISAFLLPGGQLRFRREDLERFRSSGKANGDHKCIRDPGIKITDYVQDQIGHVAAW